MRAERGVWKREGGNGRPSKATRAARASSAEAQSWTVTQPGQPGDGGLGLWTAEAGLPGGVGARGSLDFMPVARQETC